MLVHCTHATDRQLRRCAEEGVPVAVCPRSNWMLGVANGPDHPPIKKMIDYGCNVVLGTDNVMFVQPDMLREASFISVVYGLSPENVLSMAVGGSEIFGGSYFIEVGNRAAFFTVDPACSNLCFSRDPLKTLTNRMNISSMGGMYFNRNSRPVICLIPF